MVEVSNFWHEMKIKINRMENLFGVVRRVRAGKFMYLRDEQALGMFFSGCGVLRESAVLIILWSRVD